METNDSSTCQALWYLDLNPPQWLVFVPNKHLYDFTVKETRPKHYNKEKLRYTMNGGYRW